MLLLRHQRKAADFQSELVERAARQRRAALEKAQARLEQRKREVTSDNANPAMHRLFIHEIVPQINRIKTGQRYGYREALGRLARQTEQGKENSFLHSSIVDATVRVLKDHQFIINKIPLSRKTEDLRESATRLVDGWLTTFIERKRDYRTIRPETERVNIARQQLEKRLKELELDRPKIQKALADIDAYLKERQANVITRRRIILFLKNMTGLYNFVVGERLMQYSEVEIRELLGAVSKKWLAEFNRGYNRASGDKAVGCLRAGCAISEDLLSGDWKKKVDFPKPSKETLSGARQGFKTLRDLGLRSPRKKQG